MFPNQDHGRMSVSEDGTLTIEPVQREDAGQFICKGLSIAGSAYAKARLDVRGCLLFLHTVAFAREEKQEAQLPQRKSAGAVSNGSFLHSCLQLSGIKVAYVTHFTRIIFQGHLRSSLMPRIENPYNVILY